MEKEFNKKVLTLSCGCIDVLKPTETRYYFFFVVVFNAFRQTPTRTAEDKHQRYVPAFSKAQTGHQSLYLTLTDEL